MAPSQVGATSAPPAGAPRLGGWVGADAGFFGAVVIDEGASGVGIFAPRDCHSRWLVRLGLVEGDGRQATKEQDS